jgi:threonine dehydrogenase-like Zn-dependent dehydrogenase
VKPGSTVAVVGGGAVGLLGVLSAKQIGAERIIAMSRHNTRQKLAKEFGATDIVTQRGDDGVARIKALTKGIGADSVLECVGTQESMMHSYPVHAARGSPRRWHPCPLHSFPRILSSRPGNAESAESYVNNSVGCGSSVAQAFQIFQIAAMYLSPGGGQRLGARIPARKAENMVACADKFRDGPGTDETCYKDSHRNSSERLNIRIDERLWARLKRK